MLLRVDCRSSEKTVGRDGVGAEDQEGAEKAGWLEVVGLFLRRSTIRRQSASSSRLRPPAKRT